MSSNHQSLKWARAIQAIAQNGLAFCKNPFDLERYESLRELATEIISSHSEYEKEKIDRLFAEQEGYATPKVDVRCVAFKDDKILLVQHTVDDKWAMPGGWADAGLSPAEIAIKELKEETGFSGVAKKMIAVYDLGKHYKKPYLFDTYKIFLLCELHGGEFQPNIETKAVAFFGADNLPPLSEGRTNHFHINEAFEHLKNSNRPTAFD